MDGIRWAAEMANARWRRSCGDWPAWSVWPSRGACAPSRVRRPGCGTGLSAEPPTCPLCRCSGGSVQSTHFSDDRFRRDASVAIKQVWIEQSDGHTIVSEAGLEDSYIVVPTAPPTSNGAINLQSDGQLQLSAAALLFALNDRYEPRTINVWAVDDQQAEPRQRSRIRHAISSSGQDYAKLRIRNDLVGIQDNDVVSRGRQKTRSVDMPV